MIWALLVWLLLWAPLAHAATYWVSKTGNNGNACTPAQSAARQTIGAGLACLSAGDTLIVQSGTYAEGMGWPNAIPSGTVGHPTTVKSEVQYGAILKPPNDTNVIAGGNIVVRLQNYHDMTIDGFKIDMGNLGACFSTGIQVTGASTSGIIIQNNEVTNLVQGCSGSAGGIGIYSGQESHAGSVTIRNNLVHDLGCCSFAVATEAGAMGIYITSNNHTIENNTVYNIESYCIEMWTQVTGVFTDNNIFRNNVCHFTGGVGALFASGTNIQVYNNIVYDFAHNASGFVNHIGLYVNTVGQDGHNIQVYNNTVYGGTGKCVSVNGSGVFNTVVRNNLCYQNSDNTIATGGVSTTADHNLCSSGCAVSGNPLFVNASTNPAVADFHLQAGSPAIDAGTTVSAVTTDFDGLQRPQDGDNNGTAIYDIGAFEKPSIVTSNTPIAWWKLDEGTGTSATDFSGNGHTGTWSTGLAYAPGKVGSFSLHCDNAGNYVNVGAPLALTTYSWGLWFKPDQTPSTTIHQFGFMDGTTTDGLGFVWGHTSSTFRQSAQHEDTAGNFYAASLNGTLNVGTWYRIAATFDGTMLRSYLNGVLQNSTPAAAPITPTGLMTFCGYGSSNSIPGSLDHFMVWNRALTAAEVLADYYLTVGTAHHHAGQR